MTPAERGDVPVAEGPDCPERENVQTPLPCSRRDEQHNIRSVGGTVGAVPAAYDRANAAFLSPPTLGALGGVAVGLPPAFTPAVASTGSNQPRNQPNGVLSSSVVSAGSNAIRTQHIDQ